MQAFEKGKLFLKELNKAGFEAYFVGGCVRDLLCHQAVHDIDICTNASIEDLKHIFEIKENGVSFGSITVFYNGEEYQVTTFRQDLVYDEKRHPQIAKAPNLLVDLARRDFTINAIAMDAEEQITDSYHGQDDIKKKLIKTINPSPEQSFQEDPLRMLRCAYLVAKLNFQVESNTYQALVREASGIKKLSLDRIGWELKKIIEAQNTLLGLKLLKQTGVLAFLMPFTLGIECLIKKEYPSLSWLGFLSLCAYQDDTFFKKVSLCKKERQQCVQAIEVLKEFNENSMDAYTLYLYGLDVCLLTHELQRCLFAVKDYSSSLQSMYASLPIHHQKELKINGAEIKAMVGQDGSIISKITKTLITKVIAGEIPNEPEALANFVKKGCF